MITLVTETEHEIQTYWPLFENFRQSLIYLPQAELAARGNAAPGELGPTPAFRIGAKYGTRDPHTCPPAKDARSDADGGTRQGIFPVRRGT